MTTTYPLSWPDSIPRAVRRESGRFKTSLAGALKNVHDSLRKFGADSGKLPPNVVLPSNRSLGIDKPQDPGLAAWFTWGGEQSCIPVDRYLTPAANLQAIHHILEARRAELRSTAESHPTACYVRHIWKPTSFDSTSKPSSSAPVWPSHALGGYLRGKA